MLPENVAANDDLRRTQQALGLGDGDELPFLCECSDVGCRAIVHLTVAEYAAIRAQPDGCVLEEGHTP